MKQVIVTTSWDDGHKLDLKLAALLKKHGIAATFYISPKDREFKRSELLSKADIRRLAADFEIGAHTMTHPHLDQIDAETARQEIGASKDYLEAVIGKPVTAFCYPYGHFKDETKVITEELGFTFARTVQGFAVHSHDRFAAKASVHAYDLSRYYLWQLLRVSWWQPWRVLWLWRWDHLAKHMFKRARRQGGVFHLWGHSHEIDDLGYWERLDAFCGWLAKQPDVVFIPNSTVPIVRKRSRSLVPVALTEGALTLEALDWLLLAQQVEVVL